VLCLKCGSKNADQAPSCEACGQDLQDTLRPQHPQTCSLASWSLALGVTSIILSIFTALPAIICGHVALVRIKKSKGTLGGRGMATTGTILGYVFTVFFVIIPQFTLPHEMPRRGMCSSNLRQIGLACIEYAKDNGDRFPDKLSQLHPKYIPSMDLFICPSDKGKLTRDLSSPEAIDQYTSYVYIPGLKTTDKPGTIVAFDKPENHQHEGRNVLQLDASVNWEKLKQ
jgi:hypothetical protein